MIGAVIFVISFLLFLAATLGVPTLPPGNMIHELLAIPKVDYPVLGIPAWLLISAIVNGVVYGFIIWLIYSLVRLATRSKEKKEEQYAAPPRTEPPTTPPPQPTTTPAPSREETGADK